MTTTYAKQLCIYALKTGDHERDLTTMFHSAEWKVNRLGGLGTATLIVQ